MGVYLEKTSCGNLPMAFLKEMLSERVALAEIERFCDSTGEYQRKYNVYKISTGEKAYVLKCSDKMETVLYRDFLQGKGFAVPQYYGDTEYDGRIWLLMEYIDGPDLRRFDQEMAVASADTLAQIQNFYWGCEMEDGRFQRYWERIHRRAKCLKKEPELTAAYNRFLERQKNCPRTLSNGDFLQFNGILYEGRVYMIDWGFGGIMPYALDIARLIVHGSEKQEAGGFPFYMDDKLRKIFVQTQYERLKQKPDWDRYIMDIKLAALNEYVEFLEEDFNDPEVSREEIEGGFYYERARKVAEIINDDQCRR